MDEVLVVTRLDQVSLGYALVGNIGHFVIEFDFADSEGSEGMDIVWDVRGLCVARY